MRSALINLTTPTEEKIRITFREGFVKRVYEALSISGGAKVADRIVARFHLANFCSALVSDASCLKCLKIYSRRYSIDDEDNISRPSCLSSTVKILWMSCNNAMLKI